MSRQFRKVRNWEAAMADSHLSSCHRSISGDVGVPRVVCELPIHDGNCRVEASFERGGERGLVAVLTEQLVLPPNGSKRQVHVSNVSYTLLGRGRERRLMKLLTDLQSESQK
ncbi:hypothetical protein BaRGS_00009992 [Batillaria attramentaria]|uniref:Uncharacterized protein n=1 Tax=Batillaria attramentaria TaxID=370345 RepID=A0ABD0LHL2_9CAEN